DASMEPSLNNDGITHPRTEPTSAPGASMEPSLNNDGISRQYKYPVIKDLEAVARAPRRLPRRDIWLRRLPPLIKPKNPHRSKARATTGTAPPPRRSQDNRHFLVPERRRSIFESRAAPRPMCRPAPMATGPPISSAKLMTARSLGYRCKQAPCKGPPFPRRGRAAHA